MAELSKIHSQVVSKRTDLYTNAILNNVCLCSLSGLSIDCIMTKFHMETCANVENGICGLGDCEVHEGPSFAESMEIILEIICSFV